MAPIAVRAFVASTVPNLVSTIVLLSSHSNSSGAAKKDSENTGSVNILPIFLPIVLGLPALILGAALLACALDHRCDLKRKLARWRCARRSGSGRRNRNRNAGNVDGNAHTNQDQNGNTDEESGRNTAVQGSSSRRASQLPSYETATAGRREGEGEWDAVITISTPLPTYAAMGANEEGERHGMRGGQLPTYAAVMTEVTPPERAYLHARLERFDEMNRHSDGRSYAGEESWNF